MGGYSIINAESLAEATKKADGCPVLESGGSVEVYEALPM
ncbi:MAG: YciI family protein [Propionibacteriaceae bacterium]